MSNPIKTALRDRVPRYGCWVTLSSPMAAEALSHAGFDFLVVDTEHSPADGMDVLAVLQAIGNGPARPVVRVTEKETWLVKRAMDAGCATILFPAVHNAEQARAAVAAMRYPQGGNGGQRGVAGLNRAARYGLDKSYVLRANEDACTIVQIESAEGLANCKAIAAVDGVDALFVGPADLSASLGHLGNPRHPAVGAAIMKIAEIAAAQGKACGIFAATAEQARAARSIGFTFIALAADVVWLLSGARGALEAVKA